MHTRPTLNRPDAPVPDRDSDTPSHPRYDAYKDSGVEWLGAIPEHWEVERLKHLATVYLSSVDKKTKENETPVRLCNYTDVYYGSEIEDASSFMKATATPSEIKVHRLRKGDVMITKDSESPDDIAVPAVAGRDFENVICGYHLSQIRPGGCVDGKYLYYAFCDPQTNAQFEAAATGITRFSISAGDIKNAEFLVPPLPEQRTIAAYLDRETERIDALVAKKERLIELLEEKRTALISHAVTKGLDDDAEMKDSGVEWLGAIPAGWGTVKLKWVTSKIGSGVTPKGGSEAYVDEGITFLRSQNVHFDGLRLEDVAYIDKETDKEMEGSRVEPRDVLLNITGASLGRCTIVPSAFPDANVNQHVCIIRTEEEKLRPSFLNQILASNVGQQQIFAEEDGASREAVTFAEIGDFVIPRPPLQEQKRIAKYAVNQSDQIYALVEKVRDGIARLKEYRTALISAAVTGQIDVREKAAENVVVKQVDTWARMNLVLALIRRMQASQNASFGRVMLVKMLYVIQHHVRVEGMRFTYRRKDYGPYDPGFKYGLEKDLQKQGWCRVIEQASNEQGSVSYRFPDEDKTAKIESYFQKSWGDVEDQIERIVSQFAKMDTKQAEIFATLYAAWNDFLIEGKSPTDKEIVHEVRHNWHPKKQEVSKDRWYNALQWMRDNDFVPTGFGEPTVKETD